MKINLTERECWLLQNTISKDNMKYTLNGVCIDSTTEKDKLNLVSINGRAMTLVDCTDRIEGIPQEINRIVAFPKLRKTEHLELDVGKDVKAKVINRKLEVVREEILSDLDGKFPNWQMFMPTDTPYYTVKINHALLHQDFAYTYSMPRSSISPIAVQPCDPDAYGDNMNHIRMVVMPMRIDDAVEPEVMSDEVIGLIRQMSADERAKVLGYLMPEKKAKAKKAKA